MKFPAPYYLSLAALFLLPSIASARSSQDAWNSLIKNRKTPAFAYISDGSAQPNVLLYGDSISIGYRVPPETLIAEFNGIIVSVMRDSAK